MIITDIELRRIDFASAYGNANEAQKKAIDKTEGTVLVVAGPGTGKTQIIAARIARIMQAGNQPETILCLTYTDAGTIAMRERLLSFIGTDAYRVNISTFHAFCNMVIQGNPANFGYGDMQPVSELEKRAFVREMLDGLPLENPLAREKGDLYRDSKGLLDLYALMKREDWHAETIAAAIATHLAELPDDPAMRYTRKYTNKQTGETFLPGDLKQHLIDGEIRKYERLMAAVQTFAPFQQLMIANRRYDFDDMILWVIEAFRTDPDLLSGYQERYQYVLVDEYQDTSGSQNEIVDLLMGFWEDPNLFVVGDDDQSIYRFQGASIANILSFHQRYHPELVTLTENYRSSQQILDAAQALISKNNQRLSNRDNSPDLDIEKNLHANKPDGLRPEVRVYPNVLQEALGVALEIEQMHGRGEELGRVAVLYRNNRQAELIIAFLAARGVPYSARKREDVLQTPIIRRLVTILRYLQTEASKPHEAERQLFDILHYPVFKLEPLDIARLFALNRSAGDKARKPLRELLRSQEEPALFRTATELIESSISAISTLTLQELIHGIINRFGLLSQTEQAGATIWNLELLNTFFDFVQDECARNPRLNLEQFVAMLDIMASQQIELSAERVACNQQGVNLITCHSSKGLEFETVYLLGCNESEWEKKRAPSAFATPPNMAPRQDEGDDSAVEELRRLFFVAMTRAERRLVITCADKDNKDRQLARSRFVAELEQSGTVDSRGYQFEDCELEEAMREVVQGGAEGSESIHHSDFVGELLNDYRLSVTHLNNYLKCPHAFFHTRIMRVPEPRNAATAFGSSVHESLEYLFTEMLKYPERLFPPKADFIRFFTREMTRRQDSFTEVEFERRLKKGVQTLELLYDQQVNQWHRDVLLEKSFLVVIEDGIRINGLVDKLEKLDGSLVNLVDYKTGRYDRKKFQPPDPEKVEKAVREGREPRHEDLYGGDYWRQAVFYKLMVEKSPEHSFQVASTEFCFVEPDEKSGAFINEKVEISPTDEAIVMGQITEVYRKIMAREFTQRCHDQYCDWCRE
jgi:DNA helicase-2/ATP-dependent DNA helicase PcrA